jgi:glycerol-3-phosphate acyltransferase PlsY
MPVTAQLGILIVVGYVVGSIPFGLVIALAKGVDPRLSGSGNIGATNAARAIGGKRWFFLIFFLDMLKGLLPMLAAAVLGHMFSIFLKLKGGKGVSTSTGVLLGLWPYYTLPVLGALVVFLTVFQISRYISLASMVSAVSVPILYVVIGLLWSPPWPILGEQWPLLVFACLMCAMVIYKHRDNIARLRAGTETKFRKKEPIPTMDARP